MTIRLSVFDNLLLNLHNGVETLFGQPKAKRDNPAQNIKEKPLSANEAKHAAGLMRINHTGEVCAQALYLGHALTAKSASVKTSMAHAADEEVDHLSWCADRLTELDSRPSYLNPLWYTGALMIGAGAGLISDKWNLGFVAETEKQVVKHLEEHQQKLPKQDQRSRAIINQMHVDEAEHATKAIMHGAIEFPKPMRKLMQLSAKVMTTTTYYV